MSLQDLFLILKGGSSSGHWRHSGIAGHHGGSKVGGGLHKLRIKPNDPKKHAKIEKYRNKRHGKGSDKKKDSLPKDKTKNSNLEKEQTAIREKVFKEFPRLQALGDSLHVTDLDSPTVKNNLKELAMIPSAVLYRLKHKGVEVYVGSSGIPNLNNAEYLKGVQPRGWDKGKTWDIVPGAYMPATGKVLIGGGIHGSQNLSGHEVGHAIQSKLLNGHNERLAKIHTQNYDRLTVYQQQGGKGGIAGVEEMFAEGYAYALNNVTTARRIYGDDFIDYLNENDLL